MKSWLLSFSKKILDDILGFNQVRPAVYKFITRLVSWIGRSHVNVVTKLSRKSRVPVPAVKSLISNNYVYIKKGVSAPCHPRCQPNFKIILVSIVHHLIRKSVDIILQSALEKIKRPPSVIFWCNFLIFWCVNVLCIFYCCFWSSINCVTFHIKNINNTQKC